MWELFDSGKKTAKENMLLDEALLQKLDPDGKAILHFYDWSLPSFTHGYFVDPKDFLNLEKLKELRVDSARRPTGGGIVFHITDLAFSALVPASCEGFFDNTLSNYEYINKKVLKAIELSLKERGLALLEEKVDSTLKEASHFCMAKPTIYDVMLCGKKVAGAAQRKTKQGYLHQGTISIGLPEDSFLKEVLLCQDLIEAMKSFTYLFGNKSPKACEIEEIREMLKRHLKNVFLKD